MRKRQFDSLAPAAVLDNLAVRISSRRKAIAFLLSFGVVLAAVAFAVGSGWIVLNWPSRLVGQRTWCAYPC